jgi:hypothetical protein
VPFFLPGVEKFIASDAGVARPGSLPATELFAGRYRATVLLIFHKSDPYFPCLHAPPQCKSLGVPADADLHMYSRRRARAFINIYAFSLFRHQSVLSAWVRIPHLQLKNVVLRLKGWKPR